MKKELAEILLKRVYQDYNRIAPAFSKTRAFVWPELEFLAELVGPADKVLDLGCGNGRLAGLIRDKGADYLGVDPSERMLESARKKYPQQKFLKASGLALPFEKGCFDKIFAVAVLHHIPSRRLRLAFLREAGRVLKRSGLLAVTVWNLGQRRFLKYRLKHSLLKAAGRSGLDAGDIFYPFKNKRGEVISQRYLHGFSVAGLKRLSREAGLRVEKAGFLGKNKRNIYLLATPL
jgi:ubiquinone/menaquinone biosynthesis C-methylase UbiE